MLKKDPKLASAFLVETTEKIIQLSSETKTRLAMIASREEASMQRREPKMECAFPAATTEMTTQTSSKTRTRLVLIALKSKERSTRKEKETPKTKIQKKMIVNSSLSTPLRKNPMKRSFAPKSKNPESSNPPLISFKYFVPMEYFYF